jgi:DNA (cytosine-5)-methyltransferase 1
LFSNTSVYKNTAQKVYDISDENRDIYRKLSHDSRLSKLAAQQGLHNAIHEINIPLFNPDLLMPIMKSNGLTVVSLFSGGGGLDLGFHRAGYKHIASYELIPICKETLSSNLLCGNIYGGPENGDVTKINWESYQGKIDVVHGGPPCQPFSIAGAQKGVADSRNMWGEFGRAVNTIKPKAFVAENVPGLLSPKFKDFVDKYIIKQLSDYVITTFQMHTADYGVPQIRNRVFFVGFRKKAQLNNFLPPQPTHKWDHLGTQNSCYLSLFNEELQKTMGVRECLGLPNIGFDNLAPTIRSAFTGKRNTTSILNSSAGQKSWGDMQIWPNGVQTDRNTASAFPAQNGHFRLSVQDVGLIQGFPESWRFSGAVYQVLGQIGNSVSPPIAYKVALSVLDVLKRDS